MPEGVAGQDETGRLWDVLNMLRFAIQRGSKGERVDFALHVRNDNRPGGPPLVRLYALCGPGDNAEPVITVLNHEGRDRTERDPGPDTAPVSKISRAAASRGPLSSAKEAAGSRESEP